MTNEYKLVEFGHLEIWHIFWLDGGVISNVTSTWRITCKTTHPYIYICKLVFVWRQCFLDKSSGHREPKAHTKKMKGFRKVSLFCSLLMTISGWHSQHTYKHEWNGWETKRGIHPNRGKCRGKMDWLFWESCSAYLKSMLNYPIMLKP